MMLPGRRGEMAALSWYKTKLESEEDGVITDFGSLALDNTQVIK